MKILFFTLEYPPFKGGIANYYYNLVKHAPKEHEVSVLHNNDKELIGPRPLKWLRAFKALKKEIKKKKPHVVVGHILPLGTVVYLLSFFYNFKYSLVLHGMDIEYAKQRMCKAFLAKKILKKASVIICNSHYVAGITEEFLGEKYKNKIKTLNPGVPRLPIGDFQLTNKINNNKLILLTLGRLVKRKGVDMVIKAMPEIVKEVPRLEYYIAGVGPDEEYLKKEKEKLPENIQEKIHFLGEVSEDEKWQYLRKCDIFIMPNREIAGDCEGFGIVFLEANLAGKPVIGGKSGGTADAILDHETGILVDGESADEILDAVILFARDIVQRIEVGDKGMKRALSCFRWQDKAKEFYKFL
ncbi:MAG: glycosyltransferase family 4 protein [Patescibacteria group bacterium]|nr:glycosyltransferase family 4 protein [Patescibacteria group bacterium]